MGKNVWSDFDKTVDIKGLQNDIAETEKNGGGFEKVPYGNYEVCVAKMEAGASKKGDPMLKVNFKIVSGKQKGRRIFTNQVLTSGIGIHIANELLRSLAPEMTIRFDGYAKYAALIADVFAHIKGKHEYELVYSANGDYGKVEIKDIFDAQECIQGSKQVLNNEWLQRMNVSVQETGNAMSDTEIIDFSKKINTLELKNYRNAVGRQTIAVLKALVPDDIKRKPSQENLDRLISEGGLLEKKGSIWLQDFWGKKTIGGLILLPITRHQIMHLTDCVALKNKLMA